MKDSLDKESRASLVAYRLERACSSMEEATLMAQEGFFNASINRLYYACYYAAVPICCTGNGGEKSPLRTVFLQGAVR